MRTLDVTVVIPYFNEEATILTRLKMLKEQTKTPKEVVFVNSSSTDKSSSIIDSWIKENKNKLKTRFFNLHEGSTTPSSSKNYGILRATSPWIAFMDCGLIFQNDWLEAHWKLIKKFPTLKIARGQVNTLGHGIIDISAVCQTYGYNRLRPCIPSTLVSKDIFKQTGLFLWGRRAGYDAVWTKQTIDQKYESKINKNVVVKYFKTNFANSFRGF